MYHLFLSEGLLKGDLGDDRLLLRQGQEDFDLSIRTSIMCGKLRPIYPNRYV